MLPFHGVICPLLTPFNSDGSLAKDLWVSHTKWVLEQGAHYLSPFGTTGEALSLSVSERIAAVDLLLEAGIPAARLMPGTGLTALADTAVLTRHAVQAGCSAAMVLPSFFYGAVGDVGQGRYFSELINTVADDRLRVILYNIPQNSGVPITPSLVETLSKRFPKIVCAYKDSAGNWDNTAAVIAAAPGVSVFPGSELFLTQGLAAGGAGCISATVNFNAAAIRAIFDDALAGKDVQAADEEMKRVRFATQKAGLIGGMKALLAHRSGDMRWLNLRAPHLNTTREEGAALADALGAAAIAHIG